jgi:hypothetical protein
MQTSAIVLFTKAPRALGSVGSGNLLEGVDRMPFSGIADPGQRGILTAALDDYCRANNIDPGSPEFDDARTLLILLYEKHGHRTVDDLKAALVLAIRRER